MFEITNLIMMIAIYYGGYRVWKYARDRGLYHKFMVKYFHFFGGDYEEYQAACAAGVFDNDTDTSNDGKSSLYDFKENNPWITSVLIVKLNQKLKEKYGYGFDRQETALMLAAIHYASNEQLFNLERYVKEHPLASAFLFDKVITLFHEKKQKGEHINILEMKMFLFTAKLFDV